MIRDVTRSGTNHRGDDAPHRPRAGHTTVTPAPGAPLRLQVLGPLHLLVAGEAVAIPGLRRRALLARLAVARGATVPVETLIDDLWPQEPPAAARRALNNHVWRLRRHLGPFAARLQRSTSGCRLDVEPTELDLLALDVGIAGARSALSRDATVEALEAVVGLWR